MAEVFAVRHRGYLDRMHTTSVNRVPPLAVSRQPKPSPSSYSSTPALPKPLGWWWFRTSVTVASGGSYGDDRAPGGDVSLGTVDIHVRRLRAKPGLHARVLT